MTKIDREYFHLGWRSLKAKRMANNLIRKLGIDRLAHIRPAGGLIAWHLARQLPVSARLGTRASDHFVRVTIGSVPVIGRQTAMALVHRLGQRIGDAGAHADHGGLVDADPRPQ